MISNPWCFTLRGLSLATDRFSFGVVNKVICRAWPQISQSQCPFLPYPPVRFRCTFQLSPVAIPQSSWTRNSTFINSNTNFQLGIPAFRSWRGLLTVCSSGYTTQTAFPRETKTRCLHPLLRQRVISVELSGLAVCHQSAWRPVRDICTCISHDLSGKDNGMLITNKLLSRQPLLVRRKSGKKKSRDSDDEDSEAEELDDDDYDAPVNYKKMKVHLKSLRIDAVVSSGLDISRNNVEEMFLGSKLRLNGEKLLKKAKQMEEGDYVDFIVERSADQPDQMLVKRVKVIHVSSERTIKDKMIVTVKVWKKPFAVQDTLKSQWKQKDE